MMKRLILPLLLLVFVPLLPAFGPTGHRIVGEVATRYLTDEAKAGIAHILGDARFQPHSLARLATWADEIRSDPHWNPRDRDKRVKSDVWNHRANNTYWHYATLHGDAAADTLNTVPGNLRDGLLVQKLREAEAVLRGQTDGNKAEALKWLIHLVGDIHQPLHVGNGTDRGGNQKAVTWFGDVTNLHEVWDERLIDHEHLGYVDYADFLVETLSADDRATWAPTDYIAWADESVADRKAIYALDASSWEDLPAYGYSYAYDAKPILNRRLSQAGVRLAALLNDIFAAPR